MLRRIPLLCLHADTAGQVWYGDDHHVGTDSGQAADAYLVGLRNGILGYSLEGVDRVHLLGTRSNALLITGLHACSGDLPRIWIGSPQACHTAAERLHPTALLASLRRSEAVDRLPGAWHELGAVNGLLHALDAALTAQRDFLDDAPLGLLVRHPAWRALAFIGPDAQETRPFDLDAACRLLVEIGDPRWFSGSNRPHWLGRLYAYLGLTLENATAWLGQGLPGRHFERFCRAVNVWYPQWATAHRPHTPHDLLWRVYWEHRATRPRGILLATRRLVAFVSQVWLAAVTVAHPETAFEPAQFFRQRDECVAFMTEGAGAALRAGEAN